MIDAIRDQRLFGPTVRIDLGRVAGVANVISMVGALIGHLN